MYQVPEYGVDVNLEAMIRTHGLTVTLGGVTARLIGRSIPSRVQGRLSTGTSVLLPQLVAASVPVLDLSTNHVPVLGRYTAISILPSPS